jgi:tRNA threonylcarbamoyladenosine biosynthesis protein TsaB
MRVLAFDTATGATTVALCDVGEDHADGAGARPGEPALILTARDDPPAGARPNHARALLGLIEDVLERSGAGWEAVDRIAVGVGPGTFTGLRIGIATAQALARARDLPLVGVSTLHSLALGAACAPALAAKDEQEGQPPPAAALTQARLLLPAIDARRSELFVAAWCVTKDLVASPPVLAPCVLKPDALEVVVTRLAAENQNSQHPLAFGDGAVKFRVPLEAAGALVPPDESPLHRVDARHHCELAAVAEPQQTGAVLPSYLRQPDAELSLKK